MSILVLASVALRFAKSASAALSEYSALSSAVSSSWLVSVMMIESALTGVPGRIKMRSTLASVVAGMSMVSSGTRVPNPRTSSTMGPRLTVPGQSVDISTLGAAGLSRDSPIVTAGIAASRTTPAMIPRTIFLRRTPVRGLSIAFPDWKWHEPCHFLSAYHYDVSGDELERRAGGVRFWESWCQRRTDKSAQGDDGGAPAPGFGRRVAEFRYEGRPGQYRAHNFPLHPDPAPVDDAEGFQSQPIGFAQIF